MRDKRTRKDVCGEAMERGDKNRAFLPSSPPCKSPVPGVRIVEWEERERENNKEEKTEREICFVM